MRRGPKARTKRLVLAISQVVVGNCREFDVVITDEQLVINEKQTWCLPADHIWRFEPRAAIDDDILRCSIRDNMRLATVRCKAGFPVCVVFCLVGVIGCPIWGGSGQQILMKLRPIDNALMIRLLLGRQTMKSYFR